MAQMVTIEGSVTPSAELPRGERRTVQYTDRVARLVDRGFIVIVDGPWDGDTPESQTAPATGEPMVGIEHPADGTWSPEISGDGSGQALPPADAGPESTPIPPYQADEPSQLEAHDNGA